MLPALDVPSVVNCYEQFTTVFLTGLLTENNLTVHSIECQHARFEEGNEGHLSFFI